MRLSLHKTLWGLDDPAGALEVVAREGWDGAQVAVAGLRDVEGFARELKANGLRCIPQVLTFGRTEQEHLDWLRRGLDAASKLEANLVTVQGGRDGWPLAESLRFLHETCRIADDLGIAIAHETHRGRILFHPIVTVELLNEIPELLLCADLSHWVVVCERLKIDNPVLDTLAPRVVHVDARVGYEEGPQVADVRAPEAARYLEAHVEWWDRFWQAAQQAGRDELSFCPELGPAPYEQTLPFTRRPVSSRSEQMLWLADQLRQRFVTASRES